MAAVKGNSTVDLEVYASTITDFISTCTEKVIPTTRYKICPNDKNLDQLGSVVLAQLHVKEMLQECEIKDNQTH